ncbi:MAG: MATE family efflux transporter [Owenweeksia sp.]|nr:MATE family efflux transporter [Owenweeksia sp.]
MAATAMVARRVGEKTIKGPTWLRPQAIILGLGVGIATGIIGILFPKEILAFMAGSLT